MRVHVCAVRMTLHRADVLEAYLNGQDNIQKATVYERTGDVVLTYRGSRKDAAALLAAYRFDNEELEVLVTSHDSRKINQEYQEKMVSLVAGRVFRKVFLPAPIAAAYTVVAEILVPSAMSCRYYGSPQFVLGSDTFIKDTGTKDVMHMMFDMKNNQSARAMESFLKNYTEQVEPLYSYESKFSYEKEFDSFRGMFLLLGGVLSGVIAVVGTLNFLNAILTGMIARRREFAVLQSVGMTRRQLKRMLVYEGLLYTFAAVVISLILVVASEPFMGKMIEKMFWFFRFQYTIGPVVLAALIFTVIGAGVPLVVYCVVGKQTIVERLRETE